MREYRIYRHPQRPAMAVPAHSWLHELLNQEDRLVREGYRYTGSIHASSAAEAARAAGAAGAGAAGTQPGRPPLRPDALPPQQPPPIALAGVAAVVVGSAALGLFLFAREVQRPPPQDLPSSAASMARVIERERLAEYGPVEADAPPADTSGFSAWMDWPATRQFAERIDQNLQRVAAVEAREIDGEGQCRLRLEPVPAHARHQWYWWCAQPEAEFETLRRRYQAEGFTQVQQHIFIGADEQVRYSGVWHKEWRDGG
jgi:hypothetical protein